MALQKGLPYNFPWQDRTSVCSVLEDEVMLLVLRSRLRGYTAVPTLPHGPARTRPATAPIATTAPTSTEVSGSYC